MLDLVKMTSGPGFFYNLGHPDGWTLQCEHGIEHGLLSDISVSQVGGQIGLLLCMNETGCEVTQSSIFAYILILSELVFHT